MIGILSDTHDNLDAVRKAVQVFKDAGCSLIIHAGDFVAPFAARELGTAGIPLQAVYGNCDGEKLGLADAISPFGAIQEPPLVFLHEGLSILVTHSLGGPGACRGARSSSPRPGLKSAEKHDVVIFGHTHKSEVRREGRTLFVNPGEACGWLTGLRTVALLDPATLDTEIIPL